MKKIAILGITGSIGKSALEVIREQKEQFSITIASAHDNYTELFQIAEEFNIPHLVITNSKLEATIHQTPSKSKLFFGNTNLQKLLTNENYDIALNAISGSAGLISSYNILKQNKDLALANKESLVMAGHILKNIKSLGKILPVDSEHSALFQILQGENRSHIKNLILTASGGSFRNTPIANLKDVSIKQTLAHPNWDMGAKVTIDSATMFNKALEVIEAHWLFSVDFDNIEVVIHPQSVIHSMVKFIDGSVLAQMSEPSMKLPILYALSYPKRIASNLVKTDFNKISKLSFLEVNPQRYPLFFHTIKYCRENGLYPTIINAINEAAIKLFLQKKIKFLDISNLIISATDVFPNIKNPSLEEITQTNKEVFNYIFNNYTKLM